MEKKDIKKIEKIARAFFDKSGLDIIFTIEERKAQENNFLLIKATSAQDAQFIIGKQGEALAAFQTILTKILRKQIGLEERIFFDVNGYQASREAYLEELANEYANRAILEQKDYLLPPMNGFERRVVHLALESREGITTESFGEEPRRRVVVKPKRT